MNWSETNLPDIYQSGFKNRFFLKAQPTGVFFGFLLGFWVLLGFLDKQEKIGKIIKKTQ